MIDSLISEDSVKYKVMYIISINNYLKSSYLLWKI